MKKLTIVFLLVVALVALISSLFVHPATAQEKLTPELVATLNKSQQPQRVILFLSQQTNFDRQPLPQAPLARRTEMIAQLKATAVTQQAPLLNTLQQWDNVSDIRPFWLANAIALTASPQAIQQLAQNPAIDSITLDQATELPEITMNSLQITPANNNFDGLWGIDHIRTPHTWHGLGLDGTGVTVGIMDTGVSWMHPQLLPSYRGNLGNGQFDHASNWYDAVADMSIHPFDNFGHGTHVAGIIIGQNGYGVAPNAQWIAVNTSDSDGILYDSAIIAGFEWLMAPNDDPSLAPDIVNNSWGGLGSRTTLQPIVNTVQEAGILLVFATGNEGPTAGTVGSPASFPGVLSVGANDVDNNVTWFSSRGPSPLTDEIKPHLVAPGATVLSTFPNNQYAYSSGTSMSAPHVTGAIALLLQANPAINNNQLFDLLAQTSHPLTTTLPSPDSGWGLLDSYALATTHQPHGTISGLVQANGSPVAGVAVTVTTPSGVELPFETGANGRFTAWLQSGTYTLQTNVFGYQPSNQTITVQLAQTQTTSINLTALPTGRIQGQLSSNGQPISGTIHILGTPIQQDVIGGSYRLDLPAGSYTLKVHALGHRTTTTSFTLTAGQTINRNVLLTPAPSVLLVNGDTWAYYPPSIQYYHDTLDTLRYAYDEYDIVSPFNEAPTLDTLQQYDTVIWSTPRYGIGVVGAGEVISNYLGFGGHLLVSGQNVAATDGFAFGTRHWWYNQLEGRFMGQTDPSQTIAGVEGTGFADFDLTLNTFDTARNQTLPDVSIPADGSLTEPIFMSTLENTPMGLQAGLCAPYQIVYWGFGLEGVSGAETRADLVEEAFTYFATPKQTEGVRWRNEDVDQVVIQASQLVYTLTVQNLSETLTDTFNINISGAVWATAVTTPTLTLGPCQSAQTVVTIDVPPNLARDVVDEALLTAVSNNNPAVQHPLTLRHKTPALVLMVDDHRWYDQHRRFTDQLDVLGLGYDVWITDDNLYGLGSPTAERLDAYEMVVWSTGSDWYAPITSAEQDAIIQYLDGGGRLFLSSQDFLYRHDDEALAQDYFEIFNYQELVTATISYANNTAYRLHYPPYRNYSDNIFTHAETVFWHNRGVGGLATSQDDWRAVFWAYPIESLPDVTMDETLTGMLGWLTNIGDSTFEVGARVVANDQPVPYTVTLHHQGDATATEVTVQLPQELILQTGSLPSDWSYNQTNHQLAWQGTLTGNNSQQLTFSATPAPDLADGTRLETKITFIEGNYGIRWEETAVTWLNTPNLTDSTIQVSRNEEVFTYQLVLENNGLTATKEVSASWYLPYNLNMLTGTLTSTAGTATLWADEYRVEWQGETAVGQPITLTMQFTATKNPYTQWYISTADVRDNSTAPILVTEQTRWDPYQVYFPFATKP